MNSRYEESKELWDRSFQAQIAGSAYNTAPVEALVRTLSYHLRGRYRPEEYSRLHIAEAGCGAAPNLVWMAEKGIRVSGVDISSIALELARSNLARHGLSDRVQTLSEGSVTSLPFPDASLDGVLESCVFQHLAREEREQAFAEVGRVLKPGGAFIGHMLGDRHTLYANRDRKDLADDPGTLLLNEGKGKSDYHLGNIGLSHFFRSDEYQSLFPNFAQVDVCDSGYELPHDEARRRGVARYFQHMWIVYAVK